MKQHPHGILTSGSGMPPARTYAEIGNGQGTRKGCHYMYDVVGNAVYM